MGTNAKLGTLLACLVSFAIAAHATDFNVADYGAKGDGSTTATVAIQKAIEAAASSHGTVIFNPGVYLTGALFLKSGVRFRVDQGVTVSAIQDTNAYPEMPTRVAGIEMTWPAALINVYQQHDVKIFGHGISDGNGKYWWDQYWALRKQYDAKGIRWAADYDCRRARLIQVYESSQVELSDLNLHRSGFWTVHLCYSHHLTISGITIRNNIGGRGPSTDGIDVDSSADVRIQKCDIECNDDALCLKAGRDADGLRVNRPTERVTIRDCTVRAGAAGVTIGSETSGGIRDIDVSGLTVVAPVPKGICLKSARTRGGTVERVKISDMHLTGVAVPVSISLNWNPSYSYARIPQDVKSVPPYWKVLAQRVPREQGLPHFRNFTIANLQAAGAKQAFAVQGYPAAPVDNFTFNKISIDAGTAGTIVDAQDWTFNQAKIHTADDSVPTLKDCVAVTGLAAK